MTERASALELARVTLRGSRCWVGGGAVRDGLLGAAPSTDLDLVIAGEVAPAARALARAAGATAFSLSDEFGAWRVVARSRSAARSGIIPIYQNKVETTRYVLTANTSHISGERNCGQRSFEFGTGNMNQSNHARPT